LAADGQTATNAVATKQFSTTNNLTEIKTLDGQTYKAVRVSRVEPDGLVVEFAPPHGGIGIGKIQFVNLPADVQLRYGYDAQKAAAYQAEQLKGLARLGEKMRADSIAASKAAKKYHDDNQQELARREQARIKEEQEKIRIQQEEKRMLAKQQALPYTAFWFEYWYGDYW
jgi:hypothetical protein